MEQLRSADWSEAGWIALLAYALGCFTTGYYLVRFRTGQDLRELGSGSVGARNVGRLLGWQGFVLTVLGDFSKGALAVWGAQHYATDQRLAVVALLAVVAGHVWPVQLCFHGGKGMAAALGALLVYDWQLAVAFALLFAVTVAVVRKTVVPGLLALACLPVAAGYLGHGEAEVVGVTVLAGLVLVTHRKNLMAEFTNFLERRNLHPKRESPEA
jgi:glycerol-3-phosphate acyltransferase PlsY